MIYHTELIIQTVISQILPQNNLYIFENVYKYCPYFGIQQKDSYCLAWSLFYTELRILNPDKKSTAIMNLLSEWTRDSTLEYIKKYITYIQDKSVYRKNLVYNSVQENKIGQIVYSNFIPTMFKPLQLDNIVITDTLINRINVLLHEYIKINDTMKTSQIINVDHDFILNLKQKLKLILNELISYQDLTGFYDYVLTFFKKNLKF